MPMTAAQFDLTASAATTSAVSCSAVPASFIPMEHQETAVPVSVHAPVLVLACSAPSTTRTNGAVLLALWMKS